MPKSVHTPKYKKLVKLLREAREATPLSQEVASSKLKRMRTYVSKIESRERRVDVVELAELLKLYDVELHKFLKDCGLAQ